jgi:subtilisin family serine protease
VRVAVLDSGIDADHPFLTVAGSASTCPEPNSQPGRHGTHCAGLIASQHPDAPGLAPGVQLLDVKIARACGSTTPGWLLHGIDAALDMAADVLSISFGLNHLPPELPNGHGWLCEGGCVLCRAVERAVALGCVVVAAAGNEHQRMRYLRSPQLRVADELLCPARARSALTVGAADREGRWAHSSDGGAGSGKPELLGPGMDLMSTIPLIAGASTPSADLLGASRGTSVAAAVVAAAVALVIDRRRASGLSAFPAEVRREILMRHTRISAVNADGSGPRILDSSALAAGGWRAQDSTLLPMEASHV